VGEVRRDIGWAMDRLHEGSRVRRGGWHPKAYLIMARPQPPLISRQDGSAWTPTHDDLVAFDWDLA
jgi:hypothetical protein